MLNTLAQTTVSTTTAAAAGTGMLIYQVVALVVSVALAVLAYKKAKANNSDKAVLWGVVCFFLGLIGYAIFYFVEAKNYTK